ncbi:AraC family transcriptional regulator [Devosia sp. Root685]|uniref:SDR family NAD(P)-dependent oxidoreductase n=1 Tax=Devosia sp. Root685 TaxID=1736587 RepID=UPI0006FD0901|nr:SDR family oxidoreductase [Devosia sp. Root685]KRA99563.1 AraC family transcriptional regulator [Devosia sp. Root685]
MSTALITGASAGIGASYARRLAARGYDLVLVARSTGKLEALAADLRASHSVAVEVLTADLTNATALKAVEDRLRSGGPVDLLINNAGDSLPGTFATAKPDDLDWLIQLNVTVPTLLASAALAGMLERGEGSIVNIGSVVGLVPEYFPGIYAATKSYILSFSQGLAAEVGPKGIYVQAVLPAATRTAIWDRSGVDVASLQNVMEVDDLVDAALVGFDLKEGVTIPPLADAALWNAFETARRALPPSFANAVPAERYRTKA